MRFDTKIEKAIIKRIGAKPNGTGVDGYKNGKPVEVRACKKDDRFRIQKDVHQQMVRQKGNYYFVDANTDQVKKVTATRVSQLLRKARWLKDRTYPHKFLYKEDVL